MDILVKTTNGPRGTTRGELSRLVHDGGIPAASRIASVDGGRTWIAIQEILKESVDAVDEQTWSTIRDWGLAGGPISPHSPSEHAVRRSLLSAFGVAFFACFGPWLYVRAAQGEDVITALPFGFSFWWGSLCVFAVLLGCIAASVDLALPRCAPIRRVSRWLYMIGGLTAVVLPGIGFAMAWAASGFPESLQFLSDIRHEISLRVVPVGLVLEMVTGLVALVCARKVWKERVVQDPCADVKPTVRHAARVSETVGIPVGAFATVS